MAERAFPLLRKQGLSPIMRNLSVFSYNEDAITMDPCIIYTQRLMLRTLAFPSF